MSLFLAEDLMLPLLAHLLSNSGNYAMIRSCDSIPKSMLTTPIKSNDLGFI